MKEAKVTELTDEQKEFMANIQKEKDEQGGGVFPRQAVEELIPACVKPEVLVGSAMDIHVIGICHRNYLAPDTQRCL